MSRFLGFFGIACAQSNCPRPAIRPTEVRGNVDESGGRCDMKDCNLFTGFAGSGQRLAGAVVCLVLAFPRPVFAEAIPSDSTVSYNRDVRPILADKCFSCHGPDANQRQAGLRLDLPASATAPLESGATAIVAGKPEESELVRRILSTDDSERMPPSDSGKSLTEDQKHRLTEWIRQGGDYERHWSFQPPQRVAPPSPDDRGWCRNEIDRFVLARMQEAGLSPSPEADRRTLIRRVSFDLTGLPPSVEEVDAYLADESPEAYERVVDRLLASPRYGERMAVDWLDLARYADTDGYEKDSHRHMWPYRDWVIKAFNDNLPFDEFTIEQLAGDLLPDATLSQKIASAFNRNGPTTSEAGSDPAEYAAKYAVDRVSTTATVWLGLTMQCCECHDHKFDPLSTKDFYSLFAFFDQVPETPLYEGADSPPSILVGDPEKAAEADQLQKELTEKKGRLTTLEREPDGKTDLAALRSEIVALQAKIDEDLLAAPKVRIMQDAPERRPTYILVRGDYRSQGEQASPAVPTALGALPADAPANRLGLARWLVSADDPLTSRVFVNRLWAMCFGTGIVRTVDDFGSQGEWPTHPELLDWLATEFRARNWNVKELLKLIVMSSTYRQSSAFPKDAAQSDPDNRLLSRGPRRRLPAEMIRDNALAVSGLLHEQVGGPSVFPYHPPGLWEEMAWAEAPHKTWMQDHGPNLYRRGLYTFWKRSLVHPALAIFDAPTRNTCAFARPTTNTPLQSFVTLNEPSFIEAARGLAGRILSETSGAPQRIERLYQIALARPPRPEEIAALQSLYDKTLTRYRGDRSAAEAFVAIGELKGPDDVDVAEYAAWTIVAQVVLNLDETSTKE